MLPASGPSKDRTFDRSQRIEHLLLPTKRTVLSDSAHLEGHDCHDILQAQEDAPNGPRVLTLSNPESNATIQRSDRCSETPYEQPESPS